MELLILVALASWAAAGPIGHWRKTEPLRIAERRQHSAQAHERRMAWIARRGGRPTIAEAISIRIAERVMNPRGGPAQRAVAEWWADSWLYATERRRARHAKAANGQLRRQRAARAVTEWLAGRRRPSEAQSAPRRPQSDPWARPQPHHQRCGDVEDDIVDAELVDDEPEAEDVPDPRGADEVVVDDAATNPTPRQPRHPERPARPGPDTEQREETPTHDQPPDEQRSHDSATTAPTGPLASVHPIRPIGKDVHMTTHTVTSGETLDPAAGLAFVRSVRESAEQIMTQIELSETTLSSRGVTGEPIELLARMREAFSEAVASCGAAVTHFERHLSIQDQVLADPTLAGSVQGTYVGTRA